MSPSITCADEAEASSGESSSRSLSESSVTQIYSAITDSAWLDLEHLTRFVVSDLSSWAGGYVPMDIILLYRPGQSTTAQQTINDEFIAKSLPSRLSAVSKPTSSCISPNSGIDLDSCIGLHGA